MFGKEATFEVQQLQDDLQLGIQAGTHEDASDMLRIGRKQEFKVKSFGGQCQGLANESTEELRLALDSWSDLRGHGNCMCLIASSLCLD